MKGKYINLIADSETERVNYAGILSLFRMYSLKEIIPFKIIIFTKRTLRQLKRGR
jgi:hypothetical protein